MIRCCSWFAAAYLTAVSALAQPQAMDTTSVDTLGQVRSYRKEAVVISASRWAERASTVSRQVVAIGTPDVRLRNPGTSADMLESTGEVFVQRSQQGGGSPRLRGFAANSVLMVVDGIRMNNAIYRSGNLQNLIQIDANSLQSTEVLFGPGSVQYGSDALGGAMVFTLKQPAFSADGFTAHTSSMVRYASAANERALHADVDLQWASFATHTSVTASSFGDLRSGSVFPTAAPDFGLRPWYVERIAGRDSQRVNPTPLIQVASGYDQLNVLHKMRYAAGEGWTLQYTGLFTTSSNIPRYDRLVELRTQGSVALPRSAEWYYGPQTWLAQAITLNGVVNQWWASNISVVAGHQLYGESRNTRNYRNDWLRSQIEDLSIFTFNADVQLRLSDRESAGELDLYYGVEASHQDVTSTASERSVTRDTTRPAATRYPDGGSTYTTLAAYTQLRWQVSPLLTFAGGLRATSIALRSTITPESVFRLPFNTIEMNPAAVTGSLGATWNASDVLTVRGNLATGFRAPNVDDAAKVFEAEPGRMTIPNPTLGPVLVSTAEGGIDVTPLAWLTLRGTVFTSWLTNALEKRVVAGADSIDVDGVRLQPVSVQNIGTGRISGVSLAAQAQWSSWQLLATATYTEGRDKTNDVPLEHVVPAFGMVRGVWQPERDITVEADVRWSAAWLDREISPADRPLIGVTIPAGGQPSWMVVGARASAPILHGLLLTAGVENIFDVHYRPAQSGISAPGRNVVVALRWN
jgi:hemoglobin/transferrin/lactoferrin receptor protein